MRRTVCLALFISAAAMQAGEAQSPLPKSGPMPAQGAPPVAASVFALPPVERFKATDKDGDGKVTKEEFKAVIHRDAQGSIERIWLNRDTNGDGWLTAAEMNANGPARALPQRPSTTANAADADAAPEE